MQLLKDRIQKDGIVLGSDVLKVDSFLNHQIDPLLMDAIGHEFHRIFSDQQVDRVLTIEASGIAAALMTAKYFACPLVFAKKSPAVNQSPDVYSAKSYSFTHKTENNVTVYKNYIHKGENVLIIDDFLANGFALRALKNIVTMAGANPVGAGIVIEKSFQHGGDALRSEGFRIESLARIKSMSEENGIEFL